MFIRVSALEHQKVGLLSLRWCLYNVSFKVVVVLPTLPLIKVANSMLEKTPFDISSANNWCTLPVFYINKISLY